MTQPRPPGFQTRFILKQLLITCGDYKKEHFKGVGHLKTKIKSLAHPHAHGKLGEVVHKTFLALHSKTDVQIWKDVINTPNEQLSLWPHI